MNYWQRYEETTKRIVGEFASDPMLLSLEKLKSEDLKEVLLQAGCISCVFCLWLERALESISSESGRKAINDILEDEQPKGLPSHQEDRLADMCQIGLTSKEMENVELSLQTVGTIANLFRLIDRIQEHAELRTLVAIQMYGELLAGEFYRVICPLLQDKFGLSEGGVDRSRFYWPHYRHDSYEAGKSGHAAYFDDAIKALLTDELSFQASIEAAYRAQATRLLFLEQFK